MAGDTKIHDLTPGTMAATDEFPTAISPFGSTDNRKYAISDLNTFLASTTQLLTNKSFNSLILNGTSSGVVTIQSATGTWTLTLPTSAGSSGQVLSTDGAGITSWVAALTGLTIGTTTIASGTTTRVLYDNAGVLGEYTISGSGNVAMTTSPSFTTPALGTPSSGVATNLTGLPVSTGISGLGTGVATFLATPSSSNLASALTDETGTGALVFANTPTLIAPLLGTPTSGVATNLTGLPLSSGVTGTLPVANGGTGITSFGTGVATALGTNVNGSGAFSLTTSPVFVTPTLGVAVGTSLRLGVVSTTTGQLFLANASSSNLTTIQAGNATSARTYTWPVDFGSAGTVLTDAAGNGTLSWAASGTNLTVGSTTIASGTNTRLLFDNSAVLGESASLTWSSPFLNIGVSGTITGQLFLANIAGSGATLVGDGTQIMAIRSGVNAQTFRYYSTFTDASNGAWAFLAAGVTANTIGLGGNGNGTGVGTLTKIAFSLDGTTKLDYNITNSGRWTSATGFTVTTGNLTVNPTTSQGTSNTLNIGQSDSGSTLATNIAIAGFLNSDLTANNFTAFSWQGLDTSNALHAGVKIGAQFTARSSSQVTADFVVATANAASVVEAFRVTAGGRVTLGGTTSSFPGIAPDGAGTKFVGGDGTSVSWVKIPGVTVANLPSASTAGVGARSFVTDASTTLILGLGGTVAGGGANKVPVYSDGTNWIYG